MEFQKNDLVTVSIEDMGTEGEGIGKAEGFTLFVKDAVIGDLVEARILKMKKNYGYAKLEKVLKPSPYRVEPVCPYHRQCGGCQLQALSYEKQLEYKQAKVRNNLLRIGGLEEETLKAVMEPIVGMEDPFHYRNKAQYPVGTGKDGRIVTGFYAARTHSIIANTKCFLGAKENEEILNLILKYMEENHVTAYDETTGKGLVRHVLIRKGFASGEIMVCLVINWRGKTAGRTGKQGKSSSLKQAGNQIGNQVEGSIKEWGKIPKSDDISMEYLPSQEKLIDRLRKVQGMTSISVCINTDNTNVILGKEVRLLWGSPAISDTIHVRNMREEGYPFTGRELQFKISPLSFYQVNPVQTEKLYSIALEYAGLTGKENVWDLYCGIGTISLFLAAGARRVYGVETVEQAVTDARENAVRNGITNVEFFVGRAEEVLPAFYGKGEEVEETGIGEVNDEKAVEMRHPDVIVVDPPRKGCDGECLQTMLQMRPERIVYVSCDSATLARDVKILREGGYEVKRVRAVDQFGMTGHVETAVMLSPKIR